MFEPWLNVLFFEGLSHGSKSYFEGVCAMAQSHTLRGFEPRLKGLSCEDLSDLFVEVLSLGNM